MLVCASVRRTCSQPDSHFESRPERGVGTRCLRQRCASSSNPSDGGSFGFPVPDPCTSSVLRRRKPAHGRPKVPWRLTTCLWHSIKASDGWAIISPSGHPRLWKVCAGNPLTRAVPTISPQKSTCPRQGCCGCIVDPLGPCISIVNWRCGMRQRLNL